MARPGMQSSDTHTHTRKHMHSRTRPSKAINSRPLRTAHAAKGHQRDHSKTSVDEEARQDISGAQAAATPQAVVQHLLLAGWAQLSDNCIRMQKSGQTGLPTPVLRVKQPKRSKVGPRA